VDEVGSDLGTLNFPLSLREKGLGGEDDLRIFQHFLNLSFP